MEVTESNAMQRLYHLYVAEHRWCAKYTLILNKISIEYITIVYGNVSSIAIEKISAITNTKHTTDKARDVAISPFAFLPLSSPSFPPLFLPFFGAQLNNSASTTMA